MKKCFSKLRKSTQNLWRTLKVVRCKVIQIAKYITRSGKDSVDIITICMLIITTIMYIAFYLLGWI